jgi:hypothetical protein
LRTVCISGYPRTFSEKDLRDLIGQETISKIHFTSKMAEVTFNSVKLAQRALVIDGVPISGNRLSVKPL